MQSRCIRMKLEKRPIEWLKVNFASCVVHIYPLREAGSPAAQTFDAAAGDQSVDLSTQVMDLRVNYAKAAAAPPPLPPPLDYNTSKWQFIFRSLGPSRLPAAEDWGSSFKVTKQHSCWENSSARKEVDRTRL